MGMYQNVKCLPGHQRCPWCVQKASQHHKLPPHQLWLVLELGLVLGLGLGNTVVICDDCYQIGLLFINEIENKKNLPNTTIL